jgi:prepilin-type N-terminal cleavage/methylation domain-containing protein
MMKRRCMEGFTLVELLVVVAILAIVSTFVVSQYSNIQKTSAEKVSIANQQAINRTTQSYLMLNSGSGLNYLDAIIDWGTAGGTEGTFDTTLNSATTVGGVYRGVKQVSFADTSTPSDSMKAKNQGIVTDLVSKVCVYYLSSSDVAALNKLGLKRVLYFNYTTLHPGTRGGLTVTSDMEILNSGPGFRMEHVACFGTPLTNGTAVLALNGASCSNLYKSFGITLTNASTSAASGQVLLLFGLGQNASIVGARNGGIDQAPRSEILDYSYYRQYLLVIRCLSGATSTKAGAEFAGVLDPLGRTVSDARFDNEWRNGDR